eukprot:TRINITY_DN2450_c1_g1_i11.p6 TRINITY_DN2450_c1_g1~~TRINITY_DN2450_c1_g1_i11.p6  ORF type:complete len:108 (+),score=4.03 TRINITY_DN2450_c1_g1_i11:507-830(+)
MNTFLMYIQRNIQYIFCCIYDITLFNIKKLNFYINNWLLGWFFQVGQTTNSTNTTKTNSYIFFLILQFIFHFPLFSLKKNCYVAQSVVYFTKINLKKEKKKKLVVVL